jgi:trehalose 6-phosphate synthase
LSETAGAHAELGHLALTVYPFDVEQQASALWDALTMEAPERRSRRDESVTIIRRSNLDRWLDTQLDDATRIRR